MIVITHIKWTNISIYPNIQSMSELNTPRNPSFVNLYKEFAMTRIVHAPFGRTQKTATVRTAAATTEHSRPLAGMLLTAVLAALLVAADQVIDSWSDGHLLAGWVALWTVTFAVLALLAPPLRQVCNTVANQMNAWRKAHAEQRAEEALWELARYDHRVMAEIRMAAARQNS